MCAQHLGFDNGRLRVSVDQNVVVSGVGASIARIEAYSENRREPEGLARRSSNLQQVEASEAPPYFSEAPPYFKEAKERTVLVIESRIFLRECLQRSLQSALSMRVDTVSSVSELDDHERAAGRPSLVIVSVAEGDRQDRANALEILSEVVPDIPAIVLPSKHDFELMRAAIAHGAKGYIPMTMGFEIAIEAVRFVLAGGTYVPVDCLLAALPQASATPQRFPGTGAITARELSVVRAIQQGKPNKIIAYELNMCESTVKVHVRHVMKKLRAKNRTDVAIKATDLSSCTRCVGQTECWSAGRCLKRIG
jgi:DNA-binding NarL/FixJ family response regulator